MGQLIETTRGWDRDRRYDNFLTGCSIAAAIVVILALVYISATGATP